MLELGTLDGIVGCVGAGIGITLMPRAVVARHEALGLVGLHAIPPEQARVVIVLARRRDAFISSAMARFADACREIYADSVGQAECSGSDPRGPGTAVPFQSPLLLTGTSQSGAAVLRSTSGV